MKVEGYNIKIMLDEQVAIEKEGGFDGRPFGVQLLSLGEHDGEVSVTFYGDRELMAQVFDRLAQQVRAGTDGLPGFAPWDPAEVREFFGHDASS